MPILWALASPKLGEREVLAAMLEEALLKSVRELIEAVNDTLKGRLDLEQHEARTFEGVAPGCTAEPPPIGGSCLLKRCPARSFSRSC
jgi:hypothetical protein